MEQRINQIELFDLASQEEGSINTFLYEIQKHAGAQIVSTSTGDGIVLIEYTVPVLQVEKAEEKK